MSIPEKQTLTLPYYDSRTKQYQLKEDSVAVDITGDTIIFYLKKVDDASFTPINKDVDDEGWFDDAAKGIFHIIVDTQTYLMEPGLYEAEIEWVDQKTSLVFLTITVIDDIKNIPA